LQHGSAWALAQVTFVSSPVDSRARRTPSSQGLLTNMNMGLILHKSFNNQVLSAAQGRPLCKDKAAFSGRFMQNPLGRTICWRFLQEIRLEGGKPTAPDFLQKSLKIWPVKHMLIFVNRP
jgi:hypothetical protein